MADGMFPVFGDFMVSTEKRPKDLLVMNSYPLQ